MEIQALKLLVTEQDLNDLAGPRLPEDGEVRKVRIRLTPEGVHVTGTYQMLFSVAFETLWELDVVAGKLRARLARFKALGIPLALLKSMIMSTVEDALRHETALHVNEEALVLDLDSLLARQGVPVRTNLRGIRCQEGKLLIEAAGNPA